MNEHFINDLYGCGCCDHRLGPAGLQAAIHAARNKVKVVAMGKSESSSLNRADVENYFGIPSIEGRNFSASGGNRPQFWGRTSGGGHHQAYKEGNHLR